MDRLSKVLKVLLIVLIGVGVAYLSVNLYGKWENGQTREIPPELEKYLK